MKERLVGYITKLRAQAQLARARHGQADPDSVRSSGSSGGRSTDRSTSRRQRTSPHTYPTYRQLPDSRYGTTKTRAAVW